VRLVPRHERSRHQEEVAQELSREVKGLGGVTAWISSDMFANQKQIQVQLQGPEIDVLNGLASQIAGVLREIPGAVDVGLSTKGQKPEI